MQCLKRPNINAKETGNGPLLKNGWCDQRPHKKPWKRTLSIKSSSTVATTFWRIFPRKYKRKFVNCSSVSVSRWRLIWSLFIWPFRLKVCKIGSIFCKIVVIMSSKNCQSGVHFCQIWSHWRHPPKIRNCKKLEEIPHKK